MPRGIDLSLSIVNRSALAYLKTNFDPLCLSNPSHRFLRLRPNVRDSFLPPRSLCSTVDSAGSGPRHQQKRRKKGMVFITKRHVVLHMMFLALSLAVRLCKAGITTPQEFGNLLERAWVGHRMSKAVEGLGNKTGACAQNSGQLHEVETLPSDPGAAHPFQLLGTCIENTGQTGEAEEMFERALDIYTATLGPDGVEVAQVRDYLAFIATKAGGGDAGAEALFKRALDIYTEKLGPDDLVVASTFDVLGRTVAKAGGRDAEAEVLFKRALDIYMEKLGPDDLVVAGTLNALGESIARAGGRDAEAEVLLKGALGIYTAELGPDDLLVAGTVNALGKIIAMAGGRYAEVEALMTRVSGIGVAKLSPEIVAILSHLGLLTIKGEGGRYAEAEALLKRALDINPAKLGPDNVEVAASLMGLGTSMLLRTFERLGVVKGRGEGEWRREAERLLRRASDIEIQNLGQNDLQVATALIRLGVCLSTTRGRNEEAEELLERALNIQSGKLKPSDPDISNDVTQ